jgi:type IV pilus assembly protein PilM
MANFFGLDIGSNNIKLAQVKGKRVTALQSSINPTGKVGVDLIPSERQVVVEAVKKLVNEAGVGTKSVVMAVPETQVFSKIMSFPVVSTAELASAVKWQADQEIPLPPDQVELSWVIIDKPIRKTGKEQMKVLVVAVPRRISAAMVSFLDLCGLEPLRAENEALALFRLVNSWRVKGRVMVVDIGASATKMVVISDGELKLVYAHNLGGVALTRTLMQEFSLGISQAEEYKRMYGMDKTMLEGKLFKAMEPIVATIVAEIIKAIAGFNQSGEVPIERLVLTGGGVYLKGFLGFLSERVGVETVVADVFGGMKIEPQKSNQGSSFAVALGLAIEDEG